jgi:single-strand DNA-binding protein
MSDMNKIFVLGRLGADPVSRETKTGTKMVTFRVATSRKFRDKSEHTEWFSVTSWGRDAERCLTYLSKGRSVLVEGSLQTRKYLGRDGVERMSLDVRADEVIFLSGGRKLLTDSSNSVNETRGEEVVEETLGEIEGVELPPLGSESEEAALERDEIGAAELQAV